MYKNILVTGGAGFIGSHFIRYLYQKYPDYCIYNLDLLTYAGNPDNLLDVEEEDAKLPAGEKRYHFIYGDITDTRLLDIILSRHDFALVVNFAAETHVDRSIINMGDFIHTNIGGVRSLIEAVRAHQVPRFVHISTDEIYGSVPSGYSDEEAPLRPSNPYSSSKAAADLIVQSFIRTHKVPAVIVRGSNNYGTFQYPEKLIPLTITNLLENKRVPIHGTGDHVRSWLHVLDFCRAIDLVAHQSAPFEIYNVSGEERTNLQIVDLVAKQLNLNIAEHAEYISDRPAADTRYAVSSEKLRRALGWTPFYTIEASIADVARWYKDHSDWWQKIRGKREFQDHYEKQSKGQWY